MMDVVIPYIYSKHNELRYCLRSIDKYFNHRRIFIIGDEADSKQDRWLKTACNITISNEGKSREARIFNKLLLAANMPEVSDPFVMFNDDHFLTHHMTEIPYGWNSSLEEIVAYRLYNDGYTRALRNTLKALNHMDKPTKHFDIHTPIIYEKDRINKIAEIFDWSIPFGYCIKSLYCNYFEIEGEYIEDCKLKKSGDLVGMKRQIANHWVFSCGDTAFPTMAALLKELYHDKSRYEK